MPPGLFGHIMPDFRHNLFGIGILCDKDCKVLFTKETVIIYDKNNKPFLTGWREEANAKLWRISLHPDAADLPSYPTSPAPPTETTLNAFSAYDLPSVQALVRYFHAAAGYPVRSTWLAAIKAGNYVSWPGLTYANASKYCPSADETIKGHQVQTRRNLRSTKPKESDADVISQAFRGVGYGAKTTVDDSPEIEEPPPGNDSVNELHVKVYHRSKLYTDDTGRFPTRARSGNQYVMVAYHSSNVILFEPFSSRKDKHRIAAYNVIMQRLKDRNLHVDLQILDNECSKEYKQTMKEKWGVTYQLVPPDLHRRNAAERAIRTVKAHFLAILAGVAVDFPRHLWDLLLPQAELTLNLLRQSASNPKISAWEAFNGPFNYDATPLGPLGIRVIAHAKPSNRLSWSFRGRDGWSVGVSLEHYRCQRYIPKDSRSLSISDTIEFRHQHITQPSVTPEDQVLHGINQLTSALEGTPSPRSTDQLAAIQSLQNALGNWSGNHTMHPPPTTERQPVEQHEADRQLPPRVNQQPPRVQPPTPTMRAPAPRVASVRQPVLPVPQTVLPNSQPVATRTRSRLTPQAPPPEPVSHRTRSRAPAALTVNQIQASQRKYPKELLALWCTPLPPDLAAMPVLDKETGKTLEFRQLRNHPKFKDTWNTSYCNELGRLCQGIGHGSAGPQLQRVKGTNTFRIIRYDDIPTEKRSDICHTRVVCEVRPGKEDPNRTRITVNGGDIYYDGDVATPTGSLELVKLMINSVLSRPNAQFACFDISNFYLDTPLEKPEYVRVKLTDIPQEFIDEYNLLASQRHGWVYFEIIRGCYGLKQSGKLANDLLRTRLEKAGYYEAATTPGLWKHTWRPIQFTLIVDDFGVEYVGKKHADHLAGVLQQHHEITQDWDGKKFAGIDLDWNYAKKHKDRTCRLSMKNYIADLLIKLGHPMPNKPQRSPHRCKPITYGSKIQMAPEADTSKPLNEAGVRRVQKIVGALLWIARAVNNKLLVALSAIGSQQASATEATNKAIHQLLDYCATYPDDGIIYRASDMILAGHADAGFNNETKARSRAGAHIFLSEDESIPRWNGPVLTIAQIMKYVVSSAAEAEMTALFLTAKEMVPLRNTLTEMGWPQPPTPLQSDNSTAVGMTNRTLIPRKSKNWDLRLNWLRCREAQSQFRFYWDKGPNNNGDYSSKHHPDIYHETKRSMGFAGCVFYPEI